MTVVSDFSALISGSSWSGTSTSNTPTILTYSFETSAQPYLASQGYTQNFINSFRTFSATERDLARQALQQWGSACGIIFVEASAGQGDIGFGQYDFSFVSTDFSQFGGFAQYPNRDLQSSYAFDETSGGDIFYNTRFETNMITLLHEIGHALGLKHPFESDPTLSVALDNFSNTVMSYTGNWVSVLGYLDVQASQFLYGNPSRDASNLTAWSWTPATNTLAQVGTVGADVIFGVNPNDYIDGGAGNDLIGGFGGRDTLNGGAGNDTINGGTGSDSLYGGAGGDTLYGDEGNDSLFGDADNDFLYGGEGNDEFHGGDGNDLLRDPNGSNIMFGDAGSDTVTGGAGYDILYGGAGGDTLSGGALEDILVGDAGDDFLYGGDGGDVLSELYDVVNSGNDTFDGGNGIDIMYSGAGNDIVSGGTDGANNYGNLGDGNDIYHGSAGTDVVEAGAGNDTINGNNGDDSLYGEAGDDTIYGGVGIDLLSGSTGNDTLDGGANNDLLVGDDGADTLLGGTGLDVLHGFAGDDILNGGTGGDVDGIFGGSGNDSFQVGGAGFGIDYIWDFVGGAGLSDRLLVETGVAISSQSTSSGNYYINFNNGSQAVIVGRTSVLAEDIVLNGF